MMTFKMYLQSQGKSKSTVTHYYNYVLDFISWLDKDHTGQDPVDIDRCTAKEVLHYLNELQKRGQANKTRNIRLHVIKLFMNWQIEQGQRIDNPVTHIKIRGTKHDKLYPILHRQKLDQIYTSYGVPTTDDPRSTQNWYESYRWSKARNKTILNLMIHQGLTTPEINRMQLKDLKLKEGKIYISGSRKSNERTLDLKSNQIIELMHYQYTIRDEILKYHKNNNPHLFLALPRLSRDKISPSQTTTKGIWKSLTQEIKKRIPGFINFKQVRTSVITHWLGQYNLREVQYMAGHRYISSTERYQVNQTDDLKADIDQYHPI